MFSVIRYCLAVYGASNVTQRKRLQKVVRFAARVVSGRRKYDHVSDVIESRGWLHAESLYWYHCLILLNKAMTTSEPHQIAASLTTRASVHGRDTRNRAMLELPTISTESGRRRFTYCVASEFNGLPPTLHNLSHAAFKPRLRKYLRERERAV